MRTVVAAILVITSRLAATSAMAEPATASESSPPLELQQKINNGLLANGFPSVALYFTGTGTCTATLIGCQTALTAAHCVCPSGPCTPTPSGVLFFQNSGTYSVTGVARNPSWSPSSGLGRHDLAVLHLSAPVAGIQPALLNTVAKPAPGTMTSLVGFGITPTTPAGLKRYGLALLSTCSDSNPTGLCYNFDAPLGAPGQDSTGCPGDSGGPMFVTSGSNLLLAGATSGGQGPGAADCTAPVEGVYSDVFTDRAWIQAQAGSDLAQASCGGLPNAGSSLAPAGTGSASLGTSPTAVDFTFEVPSGAQALFTTVNAEDYIANDFDLYVRFGAQPTPSVFDCKSAIPGSLEACLINSPTSGTWHLLAARNSGAGVFQLTATAFKSASSPCVRDAQTACLQNERFEVKVNYSNSGGSGPGQVMAFGGQRTENTETAFYYFTSATNFEMGVKVLNACIPLFGNKFWVFASGLTDQAWTLTIRDTQTGAIKTYTNALGHLSTTFADVGAFNCQ